MGVPALNWTSVALTPPPPTPPHKGEEGYPRFTSPSQDKPGYDVMGPDGPT